MFELPPEHVNRQQHLQLVERLSAIEQSFPQAISALVRYLDGKVTKTEVVNQLESMSTPDVKFVVDAIEKLDANIAKKNIDLKPVVDGLKELHEQLQLIPKQLPEISIKPGEMKVPTSVSINNLPDWQTQFKGIVDSIKALKLEAKAPTVNVAAPNVNVPALDLRPFQNEISKVVVAVQGIKMPEPAQPTDVKGVESRLDGLGEWHALSVEELKKANKNLKKIIDKPTMVAGGGGGGGGGAMFTDSSTGALAYPVLTPEAALPIGNAIDKFRDGFADTAISQPDSTVWDVVNDNSTATGHIVNQGGNAVGSSYLRISLSPFLDGSQVSLTSKQLFTFPNRFGFGVSASQRIAGQEIFVGLVGTDGSSSQAVDADTSPADIAITGATISITSNVGTVTLASHGLTGGERINIYGCAEKRLNVGPVTITVVDANTFTVPITLANGTYSTTGGYVKRSDPFLWAKNGVGYLYENATVTNASFVARRNGSKPRILNSTVATTTATQSNTSSYTDAFNSASNNELYCSIDEVGYRSYASDGVATASGLGKYTQGIPDEEKSYKIQIRARTSKGFTLPVGRITAIAKTGTTTATVTTDIAHGLTAGDFVQIYGVRDQTNFPNLTAQTVVGSVLDPNNFTVIIGTASTTSSAGGTVWSVQGSGLAPGVFTSAVQSVSRTNNVMTLVGSATWATPLPGEYVQVHGMDGSGAAYDGAYKVLRVSTTTLELDAPGADFGSINCGGAVFRRTDVRLHFVRVLDYTRLIAEIVGGRGNTTDINNSVPVSVTGSATVATSQSGTWSMTQTTGVNTTAWTAAGWGGFLVNDVASAAITTTTTTAAVTPGSVANVGTYAHSFNIVVTAVSGTTPTMDVGVEESIDNGTNWVRIYDFERITATGAYTSPLIRSQYGTRFRYVQTISGTTPSFTRAVNRIQFSSTPGLIRRFIDRSVNINTLNSTTPTYNVEGCDTLQLVASVGAITTTAPAFQLQGSETGASTDWYNIGTPLTAVASSAVQSQFAAALPKFVRVNVSTAGVGATAGYISIKAVGK